MYKKPVFYPITLLSLTLLFLSCSDDSVNNDLPAGSVLFSIDSLSAWVITPNAGSGASVLFEKTIAASRLKVEYTVQTNVDSVHSEAWVRDSSNGAPPHTVLQYYYRSVDSLASYIMDIPSQHVYLNLEVIVQSGDTILTPHYMRLKNIRVTKQ